MKLTFSRKPVHQPDESVDTIVMTTYAEIREFLEEICEVAVPVEDDFPIFEHAHDSTKTCKLVCTEALDWVPNQIVESFVIEANPFEVSFERSLVLDGF